MKSDKRMNTTREYLLVTSDGKIHDRFYRKQTANEWKRKLKRDLKEECEIITREEHKRRTEDELWRVQQGSN